MSDVLVLGEVFARLAAALVAGAAIGVERQWHQKMAGLRTNALVALGSAGFVAFSSVVGQGDPTRVAAQVVSGIGFLGAGGGYYALSLGAAVLVVVTNIAMRSAILGINKRQQAATDDAETQYTIAVTCRSTEEAHVRSLLLHALSQGGLGSERSKARIFLKAARFASRQIRLRAPGKTPPWRISWDA